MIFNYLCVGLSKKKELSMSNGCHHGACHLHGESSHCHHQGRSGCGCSGGAHQHCHKCCCCCQQGHCGCSCQGDSQGQRLLAMADEAWLEVLKEKIKELIRSHDSKIDELAQVVAETNRNRWHEKNATLINEEDYWKRLEEIMRRQGQKK